MRKILFGATAIFLLNTIVFARGAINIKVYNRDGYPAKRVSVKGYYAGVFGTYPTQTVKTDSRGECVLSWDSDARRLVEIYINGRRHKDKYYPGKTYVFEDR
jgi:hypothetical protein